MKNKLNKFVLLSFLGGAQMCFATQNHSSATSSRQGMSVFRESDSLEESLLEAINDADLNRIRELLRDPNLNINWQDENGRSLAMWAVSTADVEIAKIFFSDPRIDYDLMDKTNATVLDYADDNRNQRIIDLVEAGRVRAGLPPRVERQRLRTVLPPRVERQRPRTVLPPSVERQSVRPSEVFIGTEMCWAIRDRNHREIRRLIEDPNLDMNWQFEGIGCTLAMMALATVDLEIIKIIFNTPGVNIDFDSRDNDSKTFFGIKFGKGKTIFDYAQMIANPRIANIVLRAAREKAPLEYRLWCAIMNDDTHKVRQLMQNPKLNINWQDIYGRTLPTQVTVKGNLRMIKMFFSHPNINFGLKDRYGKTVLDYAKETENSRIIEIVNQAAAKQQKKGWRSRAKMALCGMGTHAMDVLASYFLRE
ncbi:MAG: hypothetical protein LBI77_00560 [Puniceicoccales bacterium]|jgi:hypothetical protein|nr:hypothetical protein [Puniceicoccales bacterium]